VLVAAIAEHKETTAREEGVERRNEVLWGALRDVDLDPGDHYVRRQQEQREKEGRQTG
jgi:hypothetical protein